MRGVFYGKKSKGWNKEGVDVGVGVGHVTGEADVGKGSGRESES